MIKQDEILAKAFQLSDELGDDKFENYVEFI